MSMPVVVAAPMASLTVTLKTPVLILRVVVVGEPLYWPAGNPLIVNVMGSPAERPSVPIQSRNQVRGFRVRRRRGARIICMAAATAPGPTSAGS